MYLLQSLQGYLSVVQSFIFTSKISSAFAFLISQGTISNILGAREDMLSIPKYTVWFLCLCRVESFLRLYGFVQNEKYLSQFQGLNHFTIHKFMSLKFVDFFGEYILI